MKKKLKTIIIDDEAPAREIIKNYLQDYPVFRLTRECSNGFEALKAINEVKPDLVFLDIQMPKISGFEMLELIDEPPVIIFTTAYDEYAIKAFEVNAADYLLKPFSRDRFKTAIEKALLHLKDVHQPKEVAERLVQHREMSAEQIERIIVKSGNNIKIIPVEQILWIEAADDYVLLHTRDGKFLKHKTMSFFEKNLNPLHFVRIHRSHIVNVSTIKQIELISRDSYQIRLISGVLLPVSKSGYQKLKNVLE
ncbi:MAG: LytR/AlgR family response regulator transcription factor [Calditrichia bacterium]